jgi:predicted RNase H-like nuclease (RuvC/YqgF family)
MKRKYKLTGCARFLIFMVFFVPAIWIGVSIYQGNNPLDALNDLFKTEQVDRPEKTDKTEKTSPNSSVSELSILRQEIKIKDERIKELEQEIMELKYQLQSQN